MDSEAPNQDTGDSPYLKLPWQLVAGALAAVLLLALGAGLYANRYLRPQLGMVATATPASIVAGSPTNGPSSTAATAAPTATRLATAASLATRTLTPLPPATATVARPAATATPATAAPLASGQTPAASPSPTVEPQLAMEVGRAYEAYWRVRAQALLQLDTAHLGEVMDNGHLTLVAQRIADLRNENRAIKTKVALNYTVVEANGTSAAVFDHIDDNTYYVKAGTEDPLSQPANDVLVVVFRLQKSSGVWKVVDSVTAP